MSLEKYRKKRDFSVTPEPEAGTTKVARKSLRFVVQRHEASRLHYDFRLELDGVLKSWAVPRGPSLNPKDKRLAVHVEDHPVEYISFKGVIPEGNYGAGRVMIWDKGRYHPIDETGKRIEEKAAMKNLKSGMLKIFISGKILKGEYALFLLKNDPSQKNWLLVKHRDVHAIDSPFDSENFVTKAPVKKNSATSRKAAKKTTKKSGASSIDKKRATSKRN